MLVLMRKSQQSLVIDGRIVVTILEIDGDRVKVGIDAPLDASVLRQELCEAVREENVQAALTSPVQFQGLLKAFCKKDSGPQTE
jgi:carbon storage regulator